MRATPLCFSCLEGQIERLSNLDSIKDKAHLLAHLKLESRAFCESIKHKDLSPPQIAKDIYANVAKTMQNSDIFYEIKQQSIENAYAICQHLLEANPLPPLAESSACDENTIDSAPFDKIETALDSSTIPYTPHPRYTSASIIAHLSVALKFAIIGNVIDYGAQSVFAFNKSHFDIASMDFGAFDIMPLVRSLSSAKMLLYLADNAGENVFDCVLLRALQSIYPALQIHYAVRGGAIINDITLKDLEHNLAKDITNYCKLLDSGVKSPGFVYDDANAKTKAIYDKANVIIAKGMGNFECLESSKDIRLFMLFKIKCDVIANFCNVPKGKMMLLHNKP